MFCDVRTVFEMCIVFFLVCRVDRIDTRDGFIGRGQSNPSEDRGKIWKWVRFNFVLKNMVCVLK